MDTISWSRGRPHKKSCTSLQRYLSRKAAVGMNTFLRPHFGPQTVQRNVFFIIIIIIVVVVVVVDDHTYY